MSGEPIKKGRPLVLNFKKTQKITEEDRFGVNIQTRTFGLNLYDYDYLETLEPYLEKNGEVFLLLTELEEHDGTYWRMVLTDTSWMNYPNSGNMENPTKKRDLLDIHSVEVNQQNSREFIVCAYKHPKKMATKKLFGRMQTLDYNFMCRLKTYKVDSAWECKQVVWALKRAQRDMFQRLLEESVILAPEIYCHHAFVIKPNKAGGASERMVLISDQWMYGAECAHLPFQLNTVQWAFPVKSIISVVVDQATILIININPTIRQASMDTRHLFKKTKINTEQKFNFSTTEQRKIFVEKLLAVYYRLTNENLVLSRKHAGETKAKFFHRRGGSARSRQFFDANLAIIHQEQLLKFKKKKSSSHKKFFAIYESGYIAWGEKSGDWKYWAQVTGISFAALDRNIRESDAKRYLCIVTTTKQLCLLAPSIESVKQWKLAVSAVLGMKQNIMKTRSAADQLSAVIGAYMTKHNSNGSSHRKYIALYGNGMVTWGDSMNYYKLSASLTGVDSNPFAGEGRQSYIPSTLIKTSATKKLVQLSSMEREKGFILETDGKPLFLIAESEAIKQQWVEKAREVIRGVSANRTFSR